MAQGQKGVNWCFTINHWTEDDKDRIEAAQALGSFSYIVVGEEVGAQGTPHLQGFCVMRKRCYRTALSKIMPRAHLELARGTAAEAAAYCKKDGRFREMGQLPDVAAVAEAAGAAGGAAEKERWALVSACGPGGPLR